MSDKPIAPLVGADGNIFNLLSIARRTLVNAGQSGNIDEMTSRVYRCEDYAHALAVIGEYVEYGSIGRKE